MYNEFKLKRQQQKSRGFSSKLREMQKSQGKATQTSRGEVAVYS